MVKIGPENQGQQQVGGMCEAQLMGHEYAVRKVQWSPHRPDVLASASYDMTCRVLVSLLQALLVFNCSYVICPDGRRIPVPTNSCTSTTRIQNLWSAAHGLCMRKEFWRVAAGMAGLMYSVYNRI
jgi:hypothetical protein